MKKDNFEKPQKAKKIPYKIEKHGIKLNDDYYWFKSKGFEDAGVQKQIEAERKYSDSILSKNVKQEEIILNEFLSLKDGYSFKNYIKENDSKKMDENIF